MRIRYQYRIEDETIELTPHDIESIADEMSDKAQELEPLTDADIEFLRRYNED